MRDQGDFKSGVKHFAYNGEKSDKGRAGSEEWDSFAGTKPIKGNQTKMAVWSETKELDELKDIWSIQKNVSLTGVPLKPQGNTVQAAPTGMGFYSRHGQHNSTKITEGMRSSPSSNARGQLRSSFSLNPQRSGYSYSQPEAHTGTTTLPMLAPAPGVSQYQSQSGYGKTIQPTGNQRHLQGSGVKSSRTQLGAQKPNQHSPGSQHLSGSARTGSQWPNF